MLAAEGVYSDFLAVCSEVSVKGFRAGAGDQGSSDNSCDRFLPTKGIQHLGMRFFRDYCPSFSLKISQEGTGRGGREDRKRNDNCCAALLDDVKRQDNRGRESKGNFRF